jgi:hypothetical protein
MKTPAMLFAQLANAPFPARTVQRRHCSGFGRSLGLVNRLLSVEKRFFEVVN